MAKRLIKFELTAVDRTKAKFDSVTKGLSGMGSIAKKATMGLAKVGLAATATATAISALAKVNIDFMDKLGKTASKLGISAEFLQNMRFAADQTGVKVEALDMGLQRFIRRAAEAAQGTGEAKRAFEQLGIELKNDDGTLRDVRDVLFDVADGIKNTTSSAEQVRLAFKFFDSEGVSLVNTLKNGADGLREFEDEAENLGIIISSKTIKKAEAFKDTLGKLKNQFTAISSSIVGAVLPILDDFSAKISVMLGDIKKDEKTFEDFGKQVAVSILNTINAMVIGVQTMFNTLKLEFLSFKASALGQMMFGDIISEADKANIRILEIQKEMEQMQKQGFFIEGGFGMAEIFGADTEEFNAKLIKLFNEAMSLAEQFDGEILNLTGTGIKGFDELIKQILDFKVVIKDDNSDDTIIDGMSEKVAAFKDSLGVTQDNIDNLVINTMKNFEDTIIDGLKNGKFAFKDFADYVIEQMLRIAIQEAILKPITGSIEAFFGNVFSGFNKPPSGEGGGYTGMGVRAGGIDGRGGFPAILHPNETVIDHTKGQGMGANVNFNITTVDAAGFDELLATRKNMIISMVNQAYNSRGKMGIA